LVTIIAVFFFAKFAFAHGGGLNGYGCHNEYATGGYHCH
jgi:hypothetical protein